MAAIARFAAPRSGVALPISAGWVSPDSSALRRCLAQGTDVFEPEADVYDSNERSSTRSI
jgi:hypothetical protein